MSTITFYPDAWHAPQGLSDGNHFHRQALTRMMRAVKFCTIRHDDDGASPRF